MQAIVILRIWCVRKSYGCWPKCIFLVDKCLIQLQDIIKEKWYRRDSYTVGFLPSKIDGN